VMPGGKSDLRDLIADLSGPMNAFAFFRPKDRKRTAARISRVEEHL
jgi:hypothetical protein